MNKIKFDVVFRSPQYPVFVVSKEKLCSAFNIDELAVCCISSSPLEGETYIQVIDSKGEEFWYSPDHYALSPGFEFKKWTKKRIIEAYLIFIGGFQYFRKRVPEWWADTPPGQLICLGFFHIECLKSELYATRYPFFRVCQGAVQIKKDIFNFCLHVSSLLIDLPS